MKKKNTYLILPGCDDTNRGDQALIWETFRIAQDAGYIGNYYMVATKECALQSKKIGINRINYILPHPSEKIEDSNNLKYGLKLKIKWAFASIGDLICAIALLNARIRKIIKPVLGKKKREALEVFEKADAAFVKGGGFLHAYGGIVDSYKIFFFIYHMLLANALKIPVYILPNSFGPFNDPISKKLFKLLMKKSKFISARESVSSNYVKEIFKKDIYITDDLAVYLEADKTIDLEKKFKEHDLPFESDNLVAITVRPYRFPGSDKPQILYETYKQAIADFIMRINENGYIPVLVEHVYSENIHERDMSCIEDIMKLLNKQTKCYVFNDLSMNSRQMKAFYGHFRFIVGTRFHSVIFSMLEEVPAIAITYGGNKGIGIMKDLGLQSYTIAIDSISEPELTNKFNKMVDNEEKIKEILHAYKRKSENNRIKLIKKLQN